MNLRVFESHSHWKVVLATIKTLHSAGYEAYLAGGCVRDLLLGLSPKDFDIATSATPDQIEALFPNSESVGKSFGVILVKQEGLALEVATFRADKDYKDGRRPQKVEWTDVKGDSLRRDFTINAMFFNVETLRVIDFHEGERDLRNRMIRTVGSANLRFAEDYLRILRAIRFSAQLGFHIERQTYRTLKKKKSVIVNLPKERIYQEMTKLFSSQQTNVGLYYLMESGVASEFLSRVFGRNYIMLHDKAFSSPLFRVRDYLEFIYLGSMLLEQRLEKNSLFDLGFSSEEVRKVLLWQDITESMNAENFYSALLGLSKVKDFGFLKFSLVPSKSLSKTLDLYETVRGDTLALPGCLLGGQDLMALGVTGERIGRLLNEALRLQWLQGIHSKEGLLKALGLL